VSSLPPYRRRGTVRPPSPPRGRSREPGDPTPHLAAADLPLVRDRPEADDGGDVGLDGVCASRCLQDSPGGSAPAAATVFTRRPDCAEA
jgi:hypothetical protein